MAEDPDHLPQGESDDPTALPPKLEAIRQEALRKAAVRSQPETTPDDGTPRWVRSLPRIGWWLLAIHFVSAILGGLLLADHYPGESLALALLLSVVSQASLTLPGLYMLRDALGPWAGLAALSGRAQGVIEKDTTTEVPGDGGWLESPGVGYVFEVAGTLHRGEISAPWASNAESINRRYRRGLPRLGTTVVVRFDPAHPERSAVIGHEPRLGCLVWVAAGLVIGGLVLAVGCLGFVGVVGEGS